MSSGGWLARLTAATLPGCAGLLRDLIDLSSYLPCGDRTRSTSFIIYMREETLSSTILCVVSLALFFSMQGGGGGGAIIILSAIFSIAGVLSTGWVVGSFTAIFSGTGYVVIVMDVSLVTRMPSVQ